MTATPGKLKPPYPREHCAGEHCQRPFTDDVNVFLFSYGDKLYCLCEACSDEVQLDLDSPLRLVAL